MNDSLSIRSDIKTGKILMVSSFSCPGTSDPNCKRGPPFWVGRLCVFPHFACASLYALHVHAYTFRVEKSGFVCQLMVMLRRSVLSSLSGTDRKLAMSGVYRVEVSHHIMPLSLIMFRPGTVLSFIGSLLILLRHFLEHLCIKKKNYDWLPSIISLSTYDLLCLMFITCPLQRGKANQGEKSKA